MFAKLYNTHLGQILVKQNNKDNGPEIVIYFEPKGLGICHVSIDWSGDAEIKAWDKVDRTFEKIDELWCLKIVGKALDGMAAEGLIGE